MTTVNDSVFVVIPNTFADDTDWAARGGTSFGQQCLAGGRQADGGQAVPTVYPVETRLASGRPALLLDIGSVGNLAGDEWVKQQATVAVQHGLQPEQHKRDKPLTVRGVGQGGQKCMHNCKLPIALGAADGKVITGTYEVPTVPNSTLPALLGLTAATECRMLIDTVTQKVYMLGPGDYDLMKALPPGTTCFQCEKASSGHLMLPCAEFVKAARRRGGLQLEPELALPVQEQVTGSSSSSTALQPPAKRANYQ